MNEIEKLKKQIADLMAENAKLSQLCFNAQPEHTVSVPEVFQGIFNKAEKQVHEYFSGIRFDPKKAIIEVNGERYILVRASALSIDFLETINKIYCDRSSDEALAVGKGLLFDIAHTIGMNDAHSFHKQMNLVDPIEKLSAGPVHFAYTGWALVNIRPESKPSLDSGFLLVYDHPYSFEADSWLKNNRQSKTPVCVMNAGYSSGWCEESFGLSLTAVEITCRARGDKTCTFVMAPPERIAERTREYFDIDPEGVSPCTITVPAYFERKEIEKKLQTSEEKYRRLVENLGRDYFFYQHDTKGIFTYVSPSIVDMLGYTQEEFLKHFGEYLTDNPLNQKVYEHSEMSIRGIPQPSYEVEIYHKNRSRRILEVLEIPLRDIAGNVIGVEGIAHDLTTRYQAEKELRDSERRLSDIVEFFPDPTLVVDKEGRVTAWNRAIARLTGVSAENMLGKGDYEYAIPFYGERRPILVNIVMMEQDILKEKYASLERHGDTIAGEAFTPCVPGGGAFLNATASVLRDSQGDIIGAIESVRDITDRRKAEEELKRERDFRRTLIEASPAYFVAIRADGTTMMMNEAMHKALGYAADQVIDKDYLTTFVPEADRADVSKVFQELVTSSEPTVSTNRILTATGQELTVEWHGRSIFKDSGEFDYFFGIGIDITERIRIETILRESEERFRQVVKRAVVGVFRTALDGMALLANPAALEIFGYDSVAAFNDDGGVTRLYQNPDDRQRLIAALMQGPVKAMEMPYFRRDGSNMFLAISANLVRDEKGNPHYIEGTLEDVTARKKAELALRDSEEKYRVLFDSAGDVIFIHDLEGVMLAVNRIASERLGFTQEELITRGPRSIDSPDEAANVAGRIATVMEKGHVVFETMHMHKDGSLIPTEVSAQLITFNSRPAIIAICRDITERREAEQQLQRTMEELKRSNRELEDFAYVASHDLQEPLRKIQTFGDRLITKYGNAVGEEGQDFLKRMQGAAGRMQNLINDLLVYSRVTTQAKPFGQVNIPGLLDEILEDLETRIRPGIDRIEIGTLPIIEADRGQIRQLFHNLLSNALKFRSQDQASLIKVEGTVEKTNLVVRVKDNGIGFDEKYAESIFSIFKRLHSRSEYEGTGVGLAICKKIVERHKGSIRASGKPGEGAVFEIVLPLKQKQKENK